MKKKLNEAKTKVVEVAGDVSKQSEIFLKKGIKLSKNISKNTNKFIGDFSKKNDINLVSVSKKANAVVKGTGNAISKVSDSAKSVDVFSSKLRKQAIDDYNLTVIRYEEVALNLEKATLDLFNKRLEAVELVKTVEHHINQLANTPKEFNVYLKKIALEIDTFQHKQ